MLLKVVYLLTCRVLGLAVLVFRGDRAKDAELLVLRHENAVLRRHAGRARYEPGDRTWFAAVALCVPRTSSTSCDQPVFVDHAIDASVSSYAVSPEIDGFG